MVIILDGNSLNLRTCTVNKAVFSAELICMNRQQSILTLIFKEDLFSFTSLRVMSYYLIKVAYKIKTMRTVKLRVN